MAVQDRPWGSRDGAVVRALAPMCPRFDSLTQFHVWIGFVVGFRLCSKDF